MAKIPINNFDKFIKEKVEMHQTPVDTDRLWSNIQHTGRSKRTGILPGALLLLLVSIFITVHLLNNSNSRKYTGALNENRVIASSLNAANTFAVNTNNEVSAHFESGIKSSSDQHKDEIFQNASHTDSKSKTSNTHFAKNLHPASQTSLAGEAIENSTLVSTENVNDPSQESIEKAEALLAPESNSYSFLDEIPVHLIDNEDNSSVFAELGTLSNRNISELPTELFFPQMTRLEQDASRIQHAKFKKGFEVRVNGGVGKVFRNMELLNPEAENWMQSRMANEHQLEAVRWGMDFKFKISDKVYFFAGLEDFRINERFDYSFVEKRTYTKEGGASRLIFDETTYTVEQGLVDVYEEIHKKGTFYNQFRMINIPFGVGFTQQFGRFGLGLEGAILVNAFHQLDGKIADASNALVDLRDSGLRVSQIQSARINGVFSYQLSSRWGLNFITGADLPLKSIQLGQHMSQKYMVLQGNLGICYNW